MLFLQGKLFRKLLIDRPYLKAVALNLFLELSPHPPRVLPTLPLLLVDLGL